MRIQLFATCLGALLFPDAVTDAETLLRAAGCDVGFPRGQTCCGQPAFNAGHHGAARRLAAPRPAARPRRRADHAACRFVVHRLGAPLPAGATVSRAAYGIASTGSVVAPDEPRSRHLRPEVHVSLLREDAIVPDLASLFAAFAGRLPSALAILTGPSRSADIEQKLVVGVHGPREVHVVVHAA